MHPDPVRCLDTVMTQNPRPIGDLASVLDGRKALLCDVWGVVHNGVEYAPSATEALSRARSYGLTVVLITNAPRRAAEIVAQLDRLGVPHGAYDRVVTSGDATRDLIAEGPRRVYHLGPDRDLGIFDGLDIELSEEAEATGVVCTGLFDDDIETPDDYAEQLQRLRARNLPMICANPDIVVERGDRLIYCAGALARAYGLLGGTTHIAGKPHRPIYDLAVAIAGEVAGQPLKRDEILAIGDGVLTDIKGAANAGIDALYISAGIHAAEYGDRARPDMERMRAFLESHGPAPLYTMPVLR